MSARRISSLIFFLAFAALTFALHLSWLELPFHWDEMGQFLPASLDLYRDGAWIPHSTLANVHPPGLMAVLAGVWKVTGFSIRSARLTMLAIATVGVFFSFLLAIRLGRGTAGAPAFAAVMFLLLSPLFLMQSMMVQLDMPAMTLTVAALWLFLEERYMWSAVACTALVLTKETGLTTPLVFGVWLWAREARRREALYFAAPVVALGAWLMVLHRATGHWLGNDGFAQVNVGGAVAPLHIAGAVMNHAWALFGANGRWLGAIALWIGWRLLKGRDWSVALWVAAAQTLVVTIFGGAILERYLLPVFPIVFAAMAVAASACRPAWRRTSHGAMVVLSVVGWFWDAPYPTQFENNLAMTNFVRLQQDAAQFMEVYARGRRVATTWPLSDALRRVEFGYVERPMETVLLQGPDLASIADVKRGDYDVLVLYSASVPADGPPLFKQWWNRYIRKREATLDQIRAGLGMSPIMTWSRRGQWITIYVADN